MENEALSKLNQQSVLVSVSGRIESMVALYLLKKQGYKCMAVSFEFHGKEHLTKGEKHHLNSRCQIEDIYIVKTLCEELEIPFFVVDAREAFKAKVMEFVVSSRINGSMISPCVLCNQLKMELLLDKANKLNARYISSGHYAKVTHSQSTGEYYLHSAVDSKHDQSHFLSMMKQAHLERVIFPLADMRREDVLKIGEGMGLKFSNDYVLKDTNQIYQECFVRDENLGFFVEKMAPRALLPEGEILNEADSRFVASIEGGHHYYLGQTKLRPAPNINIDKDLMVVKKQFLKGQVFVAPGRDKLYQALTLEHFQFLNKLDQTKPCKCYMRTTPEAKPVEVRLQFKNNQVAVIEIIDEFKAQLYPGMTFSFYYKKTPGAKLIGSGVLVSGGELEIEDRIYNKQSLPHDDEELAKIRAKKLEMDFKF